MDTQILLNFLKEKFIDIDSELLAIRSSLSEEQLRELDIAKSKFSKELREGGTYDFSLSSLQEL